MKTSRTAVITDAREHEILALALELQDADDARAAEREESRLRRAALAEAAAELGVTPDNMARALALGGTHPTPEARVAPPAPAPSKRRFPVAGVVLTTMVVAGIAAEAAYFLGPIVSRANRWSTRGTSSPTVVVVRDPAPAAPAGPGPALERIPAEEEPRKPLATVKLGDKGAISLSRDFDVSIDLGGLVSGLKIEL